jgi:CRP/FNR family transcriptional regulator, dissimilatory nitrate respiration regulator
MQTIRNSKAQRIALLAQCSLFAALPQTEKDAFAGVMALREYAPKEVVFHNGEPAEGFFIVTKGKIKIYKISPDAREQVLHLMGCGELCGEAPVFEGGNYPASAAAVGKVQALYVPAQEFRKLGAQHPQLLLAILAILSRRLRQFVTLIDDLALKDVSARLAKHLLVQQLNSDSDIVELQTTKALLAARLGTIAETLSRTFKKMQARGIIDVDGKRVRILNSGMLQDLAAGMKLE